MNFFFIGGSKAHILREKGYRVKDVPILPTIIKNNRVDFASTLAHGLMGLGRMGPAFKEIMALIKDFDPQLIISDYEFVTLKVARLMGRPCVSLDNQHLLTHCRYDPPPGQRLNRYLTCALIRYLFSNASHYLVTSFNSLPPINRTLTEVFPPLIKQKLLEHQPTTGDHALVYLRGDNLASSIEQLKQSRRTFLIYGLGEKPPNGNLFFKKTSEDVFLHDLATCNYVITNGGHSLISEALYLGKPVLCHPIKLFYEQFFNAYFLKKNCFGDYSLDNACRQDIIEIFETEVDTYRNRIAEGNFFGNKLLAARLDELTVVGC